MVKEFNFILIVKRETRKLAAIRGCILRRAIVPSAQKGSYFVKCPQLAHLKQSLLWGQIADEKKTNALAFQSELRNTKN